MMNILILFILKQILAIQEYDFSLENEVQPEHNLLENQIKEFKEDNYYYIDSTSPIIINSWTQGSLIYELNQISDFPDFSPQISIDQDKQQNSLIIHSKQRISNILKFKKQYNYSISNTLTNYTYFELIACQSNLQLFKRSYESQNQIKSFNKIPNNGKQQSIYYFYDLLTENKAQYNVEFPIEQSRITQPKFILKFQPTNVKIKSSDFMQEVQGVFYQINSESILLEIPPIISNSNVEYAQIKFVITLLDKQSLCEFNEDNDQSFEIIQKSKTNDAQILIPKPNILVNFMRVICKIEISNVVVTLPIIEFELYFPPPPILSNSNRYLLIFIAILSFFIFIYRLIRAK